MLTFHNDLYSGCQFILFIWKLLYEQVPIYYGEFNTETNPNNILYDNIKVHFFVNFLSWLARGSLAVLLLQILFQYWLTHREESVRYESPSTIQYVRGPGRRSARHAHTHTMYAHNITSSRKQHVEHSTRSLHLLIVILNPCISNTKVSWFQ